jgi:hypothetical protein
VEKTPQTLCTIIQENIFLSKTAGKTPTYSFSINIMENLQMYIGKAVGPKKKWLHMASLVLLCGKAKIPEKHI